MATVTVNYPLVIGTADPAVTDDNTKGYKVGQLWFNSTSGACFKCTSVVTGTAVWASISGAGAAVMVASGASHASGLTPDTPVGAGSTKFLCENATWAIPAGGGGSAVGSTLVLAQSCA